MSFFFFNWKIWIRMETADFEVKLLFLLMYFWWWYYNAKKNPEIFCYPWKSRSAAANAQESATATNKYQVVRNVGGTAGQYLFRRILAVLSSPHRSISWCFFSFVFRMTHLTFQRFEMVKEWTYSGGISTFRGYRSSGIQCLSLWVTWFDL